MIGLSRPITFKHEERVRTVVSVEVFAFGFNLGHDRNASQSYTNKTPLKLVHLCLRTSHISFRFRSPLRLHIAEFLWRRLAVSCWLPRNALNQHHYNSDASIPIRFRAHSDHRTLPPPLVVTNATATWWRVVVVGGVDRKRDAFNLCMPWSRWAYLGTLDVVLFTSQRRVDVCASGNVWISI